MSWGALPPKTSEKGAALRAAQCIFKRNIGCTLRSSSATQGSTSWVPAGCMPVLPSTGGPPPDAHGCTPARPLAEYPTVHQLARLAGPASQFNAHWAPPVGPPGGRRHIPQGQYSDIVTMTMLWVTLGEWCAPTYFTLGFYL